MGLLAFFLELVFLRSLVSARLDVAETGRVLLPSAGTSRTDLKLLRNIRALPGRRLTVWMPRALLPGPARRALRAARLPAGSPSRAGAAAAQNA